MSLWSNVTDWAKDTASNVSSAVKNTTSSIGDWMEEKYNNAKTALTISTPTTPSTYLTGGSAYDDSSTGYNGIPKTSSNSSSNASSSSSNNSSSGTSNKSSASSNSSSNSASLAAYEALLAKTTAIENIQKSLNTVKQTDYNGEELKIDGDFGIKTQSAWDSYMKARGVPNYLAGIANSNMQVPNVYQNINVASKNPTASSTYAQRQNMTANASQSAQINAIKNDKFLSTSEKLEKILGIASTATSVSNGMKLSPYAEAHIKSMDLDGKEVKIDKEAFAKSKAINDAFYSDKPYTDVKVTKSSGGSGYSMTEYYDVDSAYKNYKDYAQVTGQKVKPQTDWIKSKNIDVADGVAKRTTEISDSTFKILKSTDKVTDIMKTGGEAIAKAGLAVDILDVFYSGYKDYTDDGEFDDNAVSASLTSAILSGVGGSMGAKIGAGIGAAFGSAVPVVGTVIFGAIGGIVGGVAGSLISNAITNNISQESGIIDETLNKYLKPQLDKLMSK